MNAANTLRSGQPWWKTCCRRCMWARCGGLKEPLYNSMRLVLELESRGAERDGWNIVYDEVLLIGCPIVLETRCM